jgi:HlyD family secretion protein
MIFSKAYRAIKKFFHAHIVWSILICLAVVGAGYYVVRAATAPGVQTRYVLGTVSKNTVISSVSASGQVSANNQLDLKPKVSGDVVLVGAKSGDQVKAGALLVEIDPTEAQKNVRDAEANLESSQIALEKLQKPATALTLTQAQNALAQAKDDLTKAYSDSDTDIINSFLDMPDIVTGVQTLLTSSDACSGQWNLDCYKDLINQYDTRGGIYRDTAYADYNTAKKAYDVAFSEYQQLGNTPENASVEKALGDTYSAVQQIAKATKSANALIQLYVDIYKNKSQQPLAVATTELTTLNTYTGKLNTHLSALLADTNSIKSDKQSVTEKQQSLDQVTAGSDALDIKTAELNVTKAQNSLNDAKSSLADYYIRAPFDGTVASVNVKKYDSAGSGTAVATLITSQKIATLSLNEVDAAKIKTGNRATLTFDAIDGLTLTGEVAEIDTLGTVSQGVVSYAVKISFDSQDARVKSGMTVNAAIQTAVHTDVLTVPSAAVKTQNNVSYVQVFNPPLTDTGGTQGVVSKTAPTQVEVTAGISDDTNVEILSGLTEGQQIVVRATSGAATGAATRTTTAPNRAGGGFGGGTQIRF